MSEAEYLNSLLEGYLSDKEDCCIIVTLANREKVKVILKARYLANKEAKVNTYVKCPICGTTFYKRTYHKTFCCTKCKDKYWNYVDDTRFIRTLQAREMK